MIVLGVRVIFIASVWMVTVFILMGFFANILFQSRLLYKLGLSFYININLSTNLASK